MKNARNIKRIKLNHITVVVLVLLGIVFTSSAFAFASPSVKNDLQSQVTKQQPYRVNKENIKHSSQVKTQFLSEAYVYKVVDGDTIKIELKNPPAGVQKKETIRLLGVDTPETVHPSKPVQFYGKEASNFTKKSLNKKTVYIAYDFDLRDKYDRLLAYVYTADGVCFNKTLVAQGYAYAYVRFPFQFMDEFVEAQTQAQQKNLGLWNKN